MFVESVLFPDVFRTAVNTDLSKFLTGLSYTPLQKIVIGSVWLGQGLLSVLLYCRGVIFNDT